MCDGYVHLKVVEALAKEDAERHALNLDMRASRLVQRALEKKTEKV